MGPSFWCSVVLMCSVPRLGDFWKYLSTNLLTKVAQTDWCRLGYFEIDRFVLKLLWILFWQLFETFGLLFYSTFWSHCSCIKEPLPVTLSLINLQLSTSPMDEKRDLISSWDQYYKTIFAIIELRKIMARFWCLLWDA